MQFTGRLENGKLSCSHQIRSYLKSLEDGRVCIDVKKGPKRSLLQNNYYRLLMDFIGNEFGYDAEEMHVIFRDMFLKTVSSDDKFGEISHIKSTSELTTKEFAEYVDKIIMRCSMQGISCPEATRDVFTSRNP